MVYTDILGALILSAAFVVMALSIVYITIAHIGWFRRINRKHYTWLFQLYELESIFFYLHSGKGNPNGISYTYRRLKDGYAFINDQFVKHKMIFRRPYLALLRGAMRYRGQILST